MITPFDFVTLHDNLDILSGWTLQHENIYAYCFEPPAGVYYSTMEEEASLHKDKYKYIFNIVNPADIVTYVAPRQYNFTRFGIDLYLPTPTSSNAYGTMLQPAMMDHYKSLPSINSECTDIPLEDPTLLQDNTDSCHRVDSFHMKQVNLTKILTQTIFNATSNSDNPQPLSFFIEALIDMLVDHNPNREVYTNQLQQSLQNLMYQWQSDNLTETVLLTLAVKVLGLQLPELLNLDTVLSKDTLLNLFVDVGKHVIWPIVRQNMNYLVTLLSQLHNIGSAHYPELCLAWMCLMDPNYTNDTLSYISYNNVFTSPLSRTVNVHGDVDVEAYQCDAFSVLDGGLPICVNPKLVAHIVNNSVNATGIEEEPLVSGLDSDFEKFLVLWT